ncbi:DUF4094 domain-containing protein [Streptomyces sp. NPDC057307]|uniref:DUF4094 domain-containing protein n=1 Tax=Streptomyces sp. NPDC057307 TaxID=3346096 RepID=UPI003642C3D9
MKQVTIEEVFPEYQSQVITLTENLLAQRAAIKLLEKKVAELEAELATARQG